MRELGWGYPGSMHSAGACSDACYWVVRQLHFLSHAADNFCAHTGECFTVACAVACVTAGSLTLEQAHIQPTQTAQGLMRNPATEEQLWSYLVQLTGALRAVHSAGMAAWPGSIAPSKVS